MRSAAETACAALAEDATTPGCAQRPAIEQPRPTSAAEARRALHICNVCGYCNGLCPVFDAAKRRSRLAAGDLDQLANLCHHCRSCLYACQYAPPHPFAVNLPRVLARTRLNSYACYAWPSPLARLFVAPGRAALLVALATLALLLTLVLIEVPSESLWAVHQGPGAFYQILPWGWMVLVAALSLGWSLFALGVGLRRFWRAGASGPCEAQGLEQPDAQGLEQHEAQTLKPSRTTLAALVVALREALTLRHLHGGGPGCADLDARPSHWRRRWHHALFYGFLLSVAATLSATLYHHLLGRLAPYPFCSAPVLLGSAGGLAMLAGALALAWLDARADPMPTATATRSSDQALLRLLSAVSLSGLLLLVWRESAAMGLLLIVHLALVLALFLLLPYSKLAHGPYRLAALWRDALERPKRR